MNRAAVIVNGFAAAGFCLLVAVAARDARAAPRTNPESPPAATPSTPATPPAAPPDAAQPRDRTTQVEGAKIVGGTPANPKDWPFIVAIGQGNPANPMTYCAGTLIGPQWVVTAAHCDIPPGDFVIIKRSDLSKTTEGRVIVIEAVIKHPDYDAGSNPAAGVHTFDNDVALLKLRESVTGVVPVPIADAAGAAMARADSFHWIAGWGKLGQARNDLPDRLQEVEVVITDTEACRRNYRALEKPRAITANMFCAGGARIAGTNGAQIGDACQGDSGGPLVSYLEGANSERIQPIVLGVISKGVGCANPALPGVYASITALNVWVTRCKDQNRCES
jgi:secreted trypsin-like serine protease